MHPNEESMLGTVIVFTTFYLATANTWFRRVNKVFGIVGNKICIPFAVYFNYAVVRIVNL